MLLVVALGAATVSVPRGLALSRKNRSEHGRWPQATPASAKRSMAKIIMTMMMAVLMMQLLVGVLAGGAAPAGDDDGGQAQRELPTA